MDYSQVSALFLSVLVHAQFNGSTLPQLPIELPPPSSLVPDDLAYLKVVNQLWYASLMLSLVTALLAILAKQWLIAFRLPSTARSPKLWAAWRQFRAAGFRAWNVPFIISILPFLLHLSLLL